MTDSGCGMTQEEIAKLFQPFVQIQAGSRQKGGGTGLGLYISRKIVESLGGTLTASSDGPGKGSTFTFRLPMRIFIPVMPTDAHTAAALAERATHLVADAVLDASEVTSSHSFLRFARCAVGACAVPPEFEQALAIGRAAASAWGRSSAVPMTATATGSGTSRGSGTGTTSDTSGSVVRHPQPSDTTTYSSDRRSGDSRAARGSTGGLTPSSSSSSSSSGGGKKGWSPAVAASASLPSIRTPYDASGSGKVMTSGGGGCAHPDHSTRSRSFAYASAPEPERALRFLVVDDVASNRLMLKRMVARLFPGCAIAEAEDGAQALRLVIDSETRATGGGQGALEVEDAQLGRQPYDAILMDG